MVAIPFHKPIGKIHTFPNRLPAKYRPRAMPPSAPHATVTAMRHNTANCGVARWLGGSVARATEPHPNAAAYASGERSLNHSFHKPAIPNKNVQYTPLETFTSQTNRAKHALFGITKPGNPCKARFFGIAKPGKPCKALLF